MDIGKKLSELQRDLMELDSKRNVIMDEIRQRQDRCLSTAF
ncbi:MAG: hypothetical protein WC082_00320 [Victivallales bacterium]